MSSPTFSRSFLQGIPEQRKQLQIDRIIQEFIHQLQNAAAEGKTSYMYDPNNRRPSGQIPPPPAITTDDLVSAFQKKFPDCDISYQEIWVDVNSHNRVHWNDVNSNIRVLKKGIVIDWS